MLEKSGEGAVFLAVGIEVGFGFLESGSKADDVRDVFGAGAETAFLATTKNGRGEFDLGGDIEGADAFGAEDFGGVES